MIRLFVLLAAFVGVSVLAPVKPVDAGQRLTCASEGGRYNTCRIDGIGEARMLRQLSKSSCIQDQSFGVTTDRRYVWVNHGCRAEFEITAAEVTCESLGGKRTYCDLSTTRGVYLVRQLSKKGCVPNQSFGVDAGSGNRIWVDYGCRGVFASR